MSNQLKTPMFITENLPIEPQPVLPPSLAEPLQTELNLARFFSFIFKPSHTRASEPRAKSWVVDANGTSIRAKILIEPVDGETLTTLDHRTYLALQKVWWDQAHEPNGYTTLTLKDLARVMQLGWGQKTLRMLKMSLRRLRKVPITWFYSFYDKNAEQYISTEEPMTILGALRLIEVRSAAAGQQPRVKAVKSPTADRPERIKSRFRFNEYIERNLSMGYTKPVFLNVAMTLRGEIALSLYSFLDIVMADKLSWERRTTELLRDDLMVRGTYTWPAERRRLLQKAVDELQEQPISTGLIRLNLTKTADGTDYKLIVAKKPFDNAFGNPSLPPALADLVEQILEVTADPHSRRYYERAVRLYPSSMIHRALAETKDAARRGRVRASQAKFYVDKLKRFAAEQGIGTKPQLSSQSVADDVATPTDLPIEALPGPSFTTSLE